MKLEDLVVGSTYWYVDRFINGDARSVTKVTVKRINKTGFNVERRGARFTIPLCGLCDVFDSPNNGRVKAAREQIRSANRRASAFDVLALAGKKGTKWDFDEEFLAAIEAFNQRSLARGN